MSGFRPFKGFGKPKRIEKAGYSFASKLESSVHDMLFLQEKAGEITDLKVQPQVHLTEARILMKPDFSWVEVKTGQKCFTEAKGMETDVWRIKLRLWKFYGEGPLFVYKGSYRKPFLAECVIPKGMRKSNS